MPSVETNTGVWFDRSMPGSVVSAGHKTLGVNSRPASPLPAPQLPSTAARQSVLLVGSPSRPRSAPTTSAQVVVDDGRERGEAGTAQRPRLQTSCRHKRTLQAARVRGGTGQTDTVGGHGWWRQLEVTGDGVTETGRLDSMVDDRVTETRLGVTGGGEGEGETAIYGGDGNTRHTYRGSRWRHLSHSRLAHCSSSRTCHGTRKDRESHTRWTLSLSCYNTHTPRRPFSPSRCASLYPHV